MHLPLESYTQRKKFIKQLIFWSTIVGALLSLFIPTVVSQAQIPSTQPAQIQNPCDQPGMFCIRGTQNLRGQNLPQTASNIIMQASYTLVFIGSSIAVLFIIFNAWAILTSQGDDSKVKKAVEGIKYAIIGLVVSILSFTVVQIIVNILNGWSF